MNAVEKPERAAEMLSHVRALMTGGRTLPAVTYPKRGSEIHLSTLDLCLQQSLFNLTLDNPPPISDDAILRFIRGRVVERSMAEEAAPAEKDGIICTVDYISPDWGLAEIKSVATDSSKFSPMSAKGGIYPHWRQRMMGYCHAYDTDSITLFVYFLIGNTASHKWGAKGRRPVDLRAWEVTFTPEELAENWAMVMRRKAALEAALNDGGVLPDEFVAPETWLCEGCQFSEICPKWRAF
jgi:hypothetical protein